ncbi:MAG: hypothetical protein ABJE95_39230 [Byssovorax sp.]
MLAGPTATLATMADAVTTTMDAFDAASELDLDRSDDDRKFFATRRAMLAPLKTQLVAAARHLEDHDLEIGRRLQVRVVFGDQVLDRGVSDGSARAKLGLKGKPGLDATHVFGKSVATLTREKLALEPQKVLEAVGRMADLPEFAERSAIAADLTKRANRQQSCLDDRSNGDAARGKLVSSGIRLVLEAADALAKAKGALDERFPRQRDYVAAFFLDVAPVRAAKGAAVGDPAAGGDPMAPTS